MQHDDLDFQKETRKTLANFHDFTYLRSCPLAHSLPLSASLSAEDLAKALQCLLREAVEHFKPPGTLADDNDRRWWPYYILYHRYIEGLSRQEIMDRLAISRATFHREQGKAIASVCDFLREREKDLRTLPVSPWPIPRIKHFVGREKELAAYRHQLEDERFVVIAGPAGMGKTSLGAELAAEWKARDHLVIWVDFHEGRNTDLEALLETIALSQAAMGQDACWRFLQAERRKESPLSLESRVRYLLTILEEGKYLLCLDNFELVNEDRAINSLCADLLRSARREKVWLLMMSRMSPRFAHERPCKPLRGLCRQDARRLLEVTGLPTLPEELFAALYARTTGVPIFLKIFAVWVHSQGLEKIESEETEERVVSFVENMAKEQDIRNYLLHEMYETFSPQERCFLTCISAFRIPCNTEDEPVIALLTAEGIQDVEGVRISLANKHVFTTFERENEIALPPLVREYFRHWLRMSPADRARIHRRVGEYYEESVGDMLEAGYHYFEAGEYERAARILSENVTWLINAGQAQAALEQLETLTSQLVRRARAELRFEVAAAHEALCHLLGRRGKQETMLDVMLALARELGDDRRLAVAHNRRARFHEVLGEFTATIAAAEAGQVTAQRAGDKVAEAESLNRCGVALGRCGDYAAARERNEQALALARETNDQRSEAGNLSNLGNIGGRLGDFAAARGFYEQALTIWRAIGEQQYEAGSLNNLGNICCYLGDFAAARGFYEQALTTWQAITDRRGEAICLNNLGVVCREEGNHVAARACHQQSLVIRRAIGDRVGQGYALTYLGMALEGLEDLDEAEAAYGEALTIRRQIGQVALAIEDVAGLGRVALAEERGERREKAKEYAEECLAHIAMHGVTGIEYPFEVYLTCVRILEACGEGERARAVLEEAYALLVERADKVGDEALRHSFLENVQAHRELVREWKNAFPDTPDRT